MNRSYYIFDFDGVICDSMYECFIVSSSAYAEFTGSKSNAVYREFKKIRKYVAPPGEYYILQLILNDIEKCTGYKSFQNLVAKYKKVCEKFAEYFFAERNKLIKKSENEWLSLHTYYPEVIKFIKSNLDNVWIVTTKNYDAVLRLMNEIDIDVRTKILTSANNRSKREIISELIGVADFKDCYFIDDHPLHVMEISDIKGVHSLLADWGYWEGNYNEVVDSNIEKISLNKLIDI